MPENQSGKERLREITASIETGIKDLFQSDKYAAYLRTMSKFHNYSVNNVMLIHMQKPDATRVAGFNKWKDAFGRSVKKGEKGIKIIAPTPIKKKIEKEKIDPDTKLPLLDENGNAVTEETEIKIPMFKVVSVFDVSQRIESLIEKDRYLTPDEKRLFEELVQANEMQGSMAFYHNAKRQHPDDIVLVQAGGFYEMFRELPPHC